MGKLNFNTRLAKVAMVLDKVLVELWEDTPYKTPSVKEKRKRIRKAIKELKLLKKSLNEFEV